MKAKLASPNYLKLVIDGQRRITDKMLSSFIRGLSLSVEEAKYFRLLVLFYESDDYVEKRELLSKITQKRNRYLSKTSLVSEEQESVLKHWSHWVIRELVLLNNFKNDPLWISQTLKRAITPRQAQESLDLLFKTNLLEVVEGKIVQKDSRLSTDDEVVSLLIRDLHAQMIDLGLKSLFSDPISDREFSGLTISLSEDQIPAFKEKIKKFRQDLNSEYSSSLESLSSVYHLELMFFPVSKKGASC